jgi:hypothetical protein
MKPTSTSEFRLSNALRIHCGHCVEILAGEILNKENREKTEVTESEEIR